MIIGDSSTMVVQKDFERFVSLIEEKGLFCREAELVYYRLQLRQILADFSGQLVGEFLQCSEASQLTAVKRSKPSRF